jgi:hypothetical protein
VAVCLELPQREKTSIVLDHPDVHKLNDIARAAVVNSGTF